MQRISIRVRGPVDVALGENTREPLFVIEYERDSRATPQLLVVPLSRLHDAIDALLLPDESPSPSPLRRASNDDDSEAESPKSERAMDDDDDEDADSAVAVIGPSKSRDTPARASVCALSSASRRERTPYG